MNDFGNNLIHIRDYYPSKKTSASSSWIYEQVKCLQEFGFNALVISPTPYVPTFLAKKLKYNMYSDYSYSIENYLGTNVIRPAYFKVPKELFLWITFLFLGRSINKVAHNVRNPRLIHAHFGQNGHAAVKLKRKLQIPLITSFYGYDSGRLAMKFKPYYQNLIKYGDIFLALSQDMKNDLIHLGFPESKIIIHHLGIDLLKFKKKKIENKLFTFLVVARLDESKGVNDVIEAFARVKNEKMQLRIVGDGTYKNNLIKMVKDHGIEKSVKFINNYKMPNPRKTVLEEMQNCNVTLLTSYIPKNEAKEGTPVVLMEAHACSKPCIATIHAGIPEIVANNKTGFLVKERDVNAIAERMKYCFDNPEKLEVMGDAARVYVEKEFNQEIQMKKLVAIYNEILS